MTTSFSSLVKKLADAGISSPRLEARLLLARILGCEDNDAAVISAVLSDSREKMLDEMLDKRLNGHFPLDKILGLKSFYKYDFIVNEDVLSPRPDTEIILEEALKLSDGRSLSVLDLGTGSGCLLLSLLKENPQAEGTGVDISAAALEVARKNAARLNVEKQVLFLQADWFADDFLKNFPVKFDIIVSNPPYIPETDIAGLDAEVREHDPHMALSGGEDGFVSYRKIAEYMPFLLADGGYVLLEAGAGQARKITEIFSARGLSLCRIVKDLSGIDRCVILKK